MDQCKVCGAPFKRHYRRGGERKIYCSKKCKYADGYTVCTCKTCGKEYRVNYFSNGNREYCSAACIQRHPCDLCGKIITGRKTFQSKLKRFCSRSCANIVHRTSTTKSKYMVVGFVATIRRFGKLCCERCAEDHLEVLCVHHKDRNRKNSDPDNLETLCLNCHGREHWESSLSRKSKAAVAMRVIELFSERSRLPPEWQTGIMAKALRQKPQERLSIPLYSHSRSPSGSRAS